MFHDEGSYPNIEPGDDFCSCAEIIATEYHEEFALFPYIDGEIVEEATLARFMPMGLALVTPRTSHDFFLPKLHFERCLLDPRTVRVTRTAHRESRKYLLSCNRMFSSVLAACVDEHGPDWLVSDLTNAFTQLHEQRAIRKVAFISVELWEIHDDGPVLVAGEIGYLIGSSYASLTGYTKASGAGTVQLAALGCLLASSGIKVWDLGMEIDYKVKLGARVLSRSRFMPILARAYADTTAETGLHLLSASRLVSARELIDSSADCRRDLKR